MSDMIAEISRLDYPLPLVMDANWVNGLGIIRSLAQVGVRSLAVTHHPEGTGLATRHAWPFLCASPIEQPDQFIEQMVRIGRALKHRGVLLLTDDTYMLTLARARAELEPYFVFTFPELSALERLMDKEEQYRVADRLGVPYPRTLTPLNEGDLANWPDTAFPVLVKGREGKEFIRYTHSQVVIAHNPDELLAVFRQVQPCRIVVQEIIPGGDDHLYTLGSSISRSGEVLATFTGRKLRQIPPGFGTCLLGESLPCPEVERQGLALLKEFGFYGVSQVEFKRDDRDGSYKLIEINGRFWKWHSLATFCGVNLSAVAYREAIGAPVLAQPTQAYGARWSVLLEGLKGMLKRGAGQPAGSPRYWLRPPLTDGLFSLEDPRPALHFVRSVLTGKS